MTPMRLYRIAAVIIAAILSICCICAATYALITEPPATAEETAPAPEFISSDDQYWSEVAEAEAPAEDAEYIEKSELTDDVVYLPPMGAAHTAPHIRTTPPHHSGEGMSRGAFPLYILGYPHRGA